MKRLIHIRDDVVVKGEEIIALLDVSTGQGLKENDEFIKNARAHNKMVNPTATKPRSMLLTESRIYMLSLSAKTAAKNLRLP